MYYSASWQLIEERVDDAYATSPGTDETFQEVFGARYVDDAAIRLRRTTDVPENIWYHLTDAQFSTVAMVDSSGAVAERVGYDPYGRARHRWGNDVNGDGSADS